MVYYAVWRQGSGEWFKTHEKELRIPDQVRDERGVKIDDTQYLMAHIAFDRPSGI
jgi:hypothetical protein